VLCAFTAFCCGAVELTEELWGCHAPCAQLEGARTELAVCYAAIARMVQDFMAQAEALEASRRQVRPFVLCDRAGFSQPALPAACRPLPDMQAGVMHASRCYACKEASCMARARHACATVWPGA
jgi:hypothetical protein